MKQLQWAWVCPEDGHTELFTKVSEAIAQMGCRINMSGAPEADIVARAHSLGLTLALVEITMEVKLVISAPK